MDLTFKSGNNRKTSPGTARITNQERKYYSFNEAKKKVHTSALNRSGSYESHGQALANPRFCREYNISFIIKINSMNTVLT